VFFAIGANTFSDPIQALAALDLGINTINAKNELYANYGGMHIAFGLLFIYGSIENKFRTPSLFFLFAITAGLAFGRIVGLLIDGTPSTLNNFLLGLEIVTAALAVTFLYKNKQQAVI
tara:strand:- start:6718 stop:7071 length:354 start_codon:yes stop_codon:yes gene_type:complete